MNLLYIKSTLVVCLLIVMKITLTSDISAQNSSIFTFGDDYSDSEIVDRLSVDEADFFITNRRQTADLLLTDKGLVVQFTDKFLRELKNEIKNEHQKGDSHFVEVLLSAVSSGVHIILSKAIAIPYSQIESAEYQQGRIIVMSRSGEEILHDIEVENTYLMEDFNRRDARRFVRQLNRRL